MTQENAHAECIYSSLGGDPELGEIVDMFVEEMPDRVATLLARMNDHDWEGLRTAAHQLKGAAGSYGFGAISPCAGKLESAIRDNDPEEHIRETVAELVELCRRVRCGTPAVR